MIGRSRAERKASAALRAQLALKQSFERIDFDFDVIRPKLAEIRELEQLQNVSIEAGEVEVPDANLGNA